MKLTKIDDEEYTIPSEHGRKKGKSTSKTKIVKVDKETGLVEVLESKLSQIYEPIKVDLLEPSASLPRRWDALSTIKTVAEIHPFTSGSLLLAVMGLMWLAYRYFRILVITNTEDTDSSVKTQRFSSMKKRGGRNFLGHKAIIGEVKTIAKRAREDMDKAFIKDDPVGFANALKELQRLQPDPTIPCWLRERVKALEEEEKEGVELLERRASLERLLDNAVEACEDSLLGGLSMTEKKKKKKENQEGGEEEADMEVVDELGGDCELRLITAMAKVKAAAVFTDKDTWPSLESAEDVLRRLYRRQDEPLRRELETHYRILLESGGINGKKNAGNTHSRSCDLVDDRRVEEVQEDGSSSSSSRELAIVQADESKGALTVGAAGRDVQQHVAFISEVVLHNASAMRMEMRLSTVAARISQLEAILEKRAQHRGAQVSSESRAARGEFEARMERIRQRLKDLVQLRGIYEKNLDEEDERRRKSDQAFLTYLLPFSLLLFSLAVYLASLNGARINLLETLWQIPYQDILYGPCVRRGESSASAVTVVHSYRRVSPSDVSTASPLSSWLLHYLLPPTGNIGCYALRTSFIAITVAGLILLHHLMAGLGMGHHRAKVHVALILYSLRSWFIWLTWKGCWSIRYILGLHIFLFITSGHDEGHAFPQRRLLVRGIIPFLCILSALYDASIYVDPVHPLRIGLLKILRGLHHTIKS